MPFHVVISSKELTIVMMCSNESFHIVILLRSWPLRIFRGRMISTLHELPPYLRGGWVRGCRLCCHSYKTWLTPINSYISMYIHTHHTPCRVGWVRGCRSWCHSEKTWLTPINLTHAYILIHNHIYTHPLHTLQRRMGSWVQVMVSLLENVTCANYFYTCIHNHEYTNIPHTL